MLYKVHGEEATSRTSQRNQLWGFRLRKRTIPYIEVNSDEATRSSVITAAWCGGSQYMQVLVNPRCQSQHKTAGSAFPVQGWWHSRHTSSNQWQLSLILRGGAEVPFDL